ncbi:MAG: DUF393 domain-containing protein [Polyangiaceae bacterium]
MKHRESLPRTSAPAPLRHVGQWGSHCRVLYDADCGVCSATARLLQRLDRRGRLELLPARSPGVWPEALDLDWQERSLVTITARGVSVEAAAVADVLAALPGGRITATIARLPGVSCALGACYRWVAKRRMRISRLLGLSACRIAPR